MNMILILCTLVICLFGDYEESTLEEPKGQARPPETDGFPTTAG